MCSRMFGGNSLAKRLNWISTSSTAASSAGSNVSTFFNSSAWVHFGGETATLVTADLVDFVGDWSSGVVREGFPDDEAVGVAGGDFLRDCG